MEELLTQLTPEQTTALSTWLQDNAPLLTIAAIGLLIWQWRVVLVLSALIFLSQFIGAPA